MRLDVNTQVGGACRADPVEPLFGTLVWAMWRSLRLTFRKVLTSAENKKLFLTTMVQLITTATARQTDPALLRECLNIVRLWLLEPENGGKHVCQVTCCAAVGLGSLGFCMEAARDAVSAQQQQQ